MIGQSEASAQSIWLEPHHIFLGVAQTQAGILTFPPGLHSSTLRHNVELLPPHLERLGQCFQGSLERSHFAVKLSGSAKASVVRRSSRQLERCFSSFVLTLRVQGSELWRIYPNFYRSSLEFIEVQYSLERAFDS